MIEGGLRESLWAESIAVGSEQLVFRIWPILASKMTILGVKKALY
jgi:hypothetical protein